MEEKSTLGVDVNTAEIAKSISEVSGVDVKNILIEVEVDNDGYVLRVIAILQNDEVSKKVVTNVNEAAKDEQHCNYGILCRSKNAHLDILSCDSGIFPFLSSTSPEDDINNDTGY